MPTGVADAGRVTLGRRERLVDLFASYRQMPPRVWSSVHGLWPGECGVRFFSWHELVAEPRST